MKKPRINKTKDQLIAEQKHLQKIEREKSLVKLMFPLIENNKTIYDAQTSLQALSGFIKVKVDEKANELMVKDLVFDLKNEPESEVKTSILSLIDMLQLEKAKDISSLLERFGNILAQHSANEFMKQPMSVVTVDKIIAS